MVAVISVYPISGDLVAHAVVHDRYGAVLQTGVDGPFEQRLHLKGLCIGSDVPVTGLTAEKAVADAAADDISLMAGIIQFSQDPQDVLRDSDLHMLCLVKV